MGGRGLAARRGRYRLGGGQRGVASDDDTVVVAGAAGGVGVFAVQLAGAHRRDRDRDRGRVQARAGCARTASCRSPTATASRIGSATRPPTASMRSSISSAAATSSSPWRSASPPTGSTRSPISRRSPSTASRATAAPPAWAPRRSPSSPADVADGVAGGADRRHLSARAGARRLRRARAGPHARKDRAAALTRRPGPRRRVEPGSSTGSGPCPRDSCGPTATSPREPRGCRRRGAVGMTTMPTALAPDRARRRVAGQGPPPAAAAAAEGVPFRGERVDMKRRAGAVVSEGTLWVQRAIMLDPRPRGFHLVTADVVRELPELGSMAAGMLHLLIQHTSASLALYENASPDVRRDFETWFDQAVPRARAVLDAHARGSRRHAGARQGGAARPLADAAGGARPARRSGPGRASTCASTATTAARGGWWRPRGGRLADAR